MKSSHLIHVGALLLMALAGNAKAEEVQLPRALCRVVPLPGDRTAIEYRGKEVLVWHFSKDYPRPFFYPLRSPKGTVLTRMGHPGAPNHDHHRSVWFAHHKVAGVNFWGDEGPNRGAVKQKQWLAYENGDQEAIMAVLLGWFDGEGQELMEQEVVAAWRPGERAYQLELQITFRPTGESLELEKTNFGFLAVRMAKELSGHFGYGELRDSEGRKGEKAIFGKSAKWMDYSGPTAAVPDGREGVAYFDHPSNPNYPSHWHVREDGWMGAGFCLKSAHALKKDAPLVLRYLLLAHSGKAGEKELQKVAVDFAARPGFTVAKSKRPHRQFEVARTK